VLRPWLAHYDHWTPPGITVPARPLTDILDITAAEVPDRLATAFLGATLTFADLKRMSDWLAAALRRFGIAPGDRVGIMLPTCPQYTVCAFAVLRAGAIVVNINPSFTAREVAEIAADARPRLLIALDTVAALVTSVQPATTIERVIVTSLAEFSADAAPPPRVPGTIALATLCDGAGAPPVMPTQAAADDVAVLQYTGGTTGTPKGAMLTHRNIFANVLQAEAFTERRHTRGEARFLVTLPFFHTFGFTVGMMKGTWLGALQILIPRFSVRAVLDAVRTYRPTYFPGVPTIWSALLAHPDAASAGLEQIAICTSGAAPLPRRVIDAFESLTGRPLFEGFGLTEASPVTHSTPQLGVRKPGTVGLPMPGTDIRVVDVETGTIDLAPGQPGELCICGPQVMKGYWQRPDETAQVLRRGADGRVWLHTGDIATIDEDGYTTILQRKKDLIIVDGFNVYPSEVESVLMMHPAVRMSAAVGIDDAHHGEVVHAFVVLHHDAAAAGSELIAHCRAHLAPFKVPAAVHLRGDLPISAVGKVLYRVLRDQAIAGTTERS
jgi:long-chain acyl-CoA synthetase